jgi:hypothetical protein
LGASPYPSMERYLAELPGGVDAYPHAQTKGAVLRLALDDERLRLPPETLPAALAAHLLNPPTVNSWFPEVHFNALMLAVFDTHFTGDGGHAEYEAWILERNRALLRRPLYRILFAVASPERILVGAENRWAAFRRGSVMHVDAHTVASVTLSVHHAKHLMTDLAARGLKMALRAAIELAGAREVALGYELTDPELTRYVGSWSR